MGGKLSNNKFARTRGGNPYKSTNVDSNHYKKRLNRELTTARQTGGTDYLHQDNNR